MPEFKGTAYWAYTNKVDPYSNKYSIDLSVDDDVAKALTDIGLSVKTDTKEVNNKGKFIKFRSKFKPLINDTKGTLLPDNFLIPNGSKVKVMVDVDPDYKLKTGKSIVVARLKSIMVIDLAEYKAASFKPEEGFEYTAPEPSPDDFDSVDEELL